MKEFIGYTELYKLIAKSRLLGDVSIGYSELCNIARELPYIMCDSLKDTTWRVSIKDVGSGNVHSGLTSILHEELTITNKNYGIRTRYGDFKIEDNRKVRVYVALYSNRVDKALEKMEGLSYDKSIAFNIAECSGTVEAVRKDGKLFTSWKSQEEVKDGCIHPVSLIDIADGLDIVLDRAMDMLICDGKKKSVRGVPEARGFSLILNRQ